MTTITEEMRKVYAEAKSKPGFRPKGAMWVLKRYAFEAFQRETGVYANHPKICVTFCDIPVAELVRGPIEAPPVRLVSAGECFAATDTPIN